ncbi:hypothetical protein Peur_045719 [Populus x canadensis]
MDCSRCCTREDGVHDVANGGRQCNAAAGAGARCYSCLIFSGEKAAVTVGFFGVVYCGVLPAGGEEDDGLEMGLEQGLLKVGWMAFDLKISEEDESLGFFLVGISQKQRR